MAVPFWIRIIVECWRELAAPPLCRIPVKWRDTGLITWQPSVVNPVALVVGDQLVDERHGVSSTKRMGVTQKFPSIASATTPEHPPDVLVKLGIGMYVNGKALADAIFIGLPAQCFKVRYQHCGRQSLLDKLDCFALHGVVDVDIDLCGG